MARHKKKLPEFDGSESKDNDIISEDYTINIKENQEESSQDKLKGRHFAFVVYPESAPEDWVDRLQETGLSFVVSPLHDQDINPDNTPKKPHYHVIVSWGNTTTFKSAKGLCDMLNCPIPQLLKSCNGMYRYLTHKDNPEKHQYTEQPKTYNGWVRPLDGADVTRLKEEIYDIVFKDDCRDYSVLVSCCKRYGSEYFNVVSNHTFFFKAVCDSYRNNPIRSLEEWSKILDDDSEQEKIRNRIDTIKDGEMARVLRELRENGYSVTNDMTGEIINAQERWYNNHEIQN